MKHQQVVPDYAAMLQTSGTCLCLVFCGWILFKLVHAVFWLPGYLEKNQGRLYQKLEQQHDAPSDAAEDDLLPQSKADVDGLQDANAERNAENVDATIEEEQEDDELEENSDREETDSVGSESDSKKHK
ncbi:uncharacterized protein LOC118460457 [Anopheles albimanus]|uniref:uncharacterized protein LOC118460457 n=1 Tax=Anopheles albimanus TaxID=7167 RepID=UPI00163E4A01|nr:uncharacterized protein LOC118460457 [Anopheles albimanus]